MDACRHLANNGFEKDCLRGLVALDIIEPAIFFKTSRFYCEIGSHVIVCCWCWSSAEQVMKATEVVPSQGAEKVSESGRENQRDQTAKTSFFTVNQCTGEKWLFFVVCLLGQLSQRTWSIVARLQTTHLSCHFPDKTHQVEDLNDIRSWIPSKSPL